MSKSGALIRVKHKGSFANFEAFAKRNRKKELREVLERLGQIGVDALSAATPVRTGKTAASWSYVVEEDQGRISLTWLNSNTTAEGDNIVTLLIRGHGTRNGHYVRGNDFVTPAIQPVFDEIAEQACAEVMK